MKRWTASADRFSSLQLRILIFGLLPALLALTALLVLFFGVRALAVQTAAAEQARSTMEAARNSALEVERSRARLHELFATSVRGDLNRLFQIRQSFVDSLPALVASIETAGLDDSLPDLEGLPDRVLDAAEALVRRDVPASQAIMSRVDGEMEDLAADLDRFAASQFVLETRAREAAVRALQSVSWVAATLLIMAVVVIVLGAVAVERLIRKPLGEILHAIDSIRRGQPWTPFPEGRRDDGVSRIHEAINALNAHELQRRETVRQLEHLAQYDALTDLPNRVLLSDRIMQAMVRSRRSGRLVAIVFVDLDEFKQVNDDYGHDFGDRVLVAVSGRMQGALREEDTLARLGGDEFVVVLPDLPALDAIEPILGRLLENIARPVEQDGKTAHVTASAGITVYPQEGEIDPDQLLRQADQAMYRAKQIGRNNYAFFDAGQERELREQHELIARLRVALEHDEFRLFYQPKVDLMSGEVIGAEALIRWQHPDQGLLSPAAFLFAVERHSLAVDLGQWVLEQALDDCQGWLSAGRRIPVAINLFPLQLQQPDFLSRLRDALARHGQVSPRDIELEIVETAALEDIQQASRVIRGCAEHGIDFALDDFGTGYSSLTYLRRLPVKTLKLDQSFVRGMLADREDVVIIQGVLNMAEAFGLKVVAEGVETLEHGEQLLQMGCRLAQGYAIAKPMPAAEIVDWTNCWNLPARWRQARMASLQQNPDAGSTGS